MRSLSTFAKTTLTEAIKPQPSDFEVALGFGERYAEKLSTFLNENYHIIDFVCSDNGIEKLVECKTVTSGIRISIVEDALSENTVFRIVEICNDGTKHSITESKYSSYKDYQEIIENLK